MATTVILGSGIIGLSTALHLSRHQPGSSIHLVDSSPQLFASASGYAGGFVAKNWFQPSVASLGKLSFEEHRKLAEKEGGREKWGYSESVTLSLESWRHRPAGKNTEDWLLEDASRAEPVRDSEDEGESGDIPRWLRRVDGDIINVMDDGSGTAIVDPLKLCQFLLDKCKAAGVQLHHPATPLRIGTDVRGELASIRVGYTDSSTETEIPATRMLLCCGAWTPQVFKRLFSDASVSIPVATLAGHSLVVKNPCDHGGIDSSHSVFCTLGDLSPEVFSRPSGLIYLSGVNSSATPLPQLATGAETVQTSLDELKAVARRVFGLGVGEELQVVRTGLCFRPITSRGTPFLGRVGDEHLGTGVGARPGAEGGVFIATGHGPWGISLSLGTGKVMAEMMQARPLSADVSRLGLYE